MDKAHDKTERTIASKLVRATLSSGYTVSVWEGGDWTIKQSHSHAAILEALASTDSDTVVFYKDGRRVGWVLLIYGNGEELISDYSDNEKTRAIVEATEK